MTPFEAFRKHLPENITLYPSEENISIAERDLVHRAVQQEVERNQEASAQRSERNFNNKLSKRQKRLELGAKV
jgi:hypothetical protein